MFLKEINRHYEIEQFLKSKTAFFFDLDGTIINSEPVHAQAIMTILTNCEIHDYSMEKICEKFHGMTDSAVFYNLTNDFKHLNLSLSDFLKQKNSILVDEFNSLSYSSLKKLLIPGILDLLIHLNKNNYKTALVTASEQEVANTILSNIKISNLFNSIKANSSTAQGKPCPSPYLSAMRELNVKSSELVILEDSSVGIQAALKAGASVIKIPAIT